MTRHLNPAFTALKTSTALIHLRIRRGHERDDGEQGSGGPLIVKRGGKGDDGDIGFMVGTGIAYRRRRGDGPQRCAVPAILEPHQGQEIGRPDRRVRGHDGGLRAVVLAQPGLAGQRRFPGVVPDLRAHGGRELGYPLSPTGQPARRNPPADDGDYRMQSKLPSIIIISADKCEEILQHLVDPRRNLVVAQEGIRSAILQARRAAERMPDQTSGQIWVQAVKDPLDTASQEIEEATGNYVKLYEAVAGMWQVFSEMMDLWKQGLIPICGES